MPKKKKKATTIFLETKIFSHYVEFIPTEINFTKQFDDSIAYISLCRESYTTNSYFKTNEKQT